MPEITETKLKEQIAKEQIAFTFCTATKSCSCAAI